MNKFISLYRIVPKELRLRAIIFLFSTSLGTSLEVFGVAALIPFVSILVNSDKFYSNHAITGITEFIGLPESLINPLAFGSIFIILYLSGLIFRFLSLFLAISFATNLEYNLSRKMLSFYSSQDYEWFCSSHSADILQQVLSEVSNVVHGTIFSALMIGSQLLLLSGLLCFLLIIKPAAVIVGLLMFVFVYGCIFLGLRRLISDIGKKRIDANRRRARSVVELCGSIAQLKIGGHENFFLKKFEIPALEYAKYQKIAQLSAQAPKFVVDGVIFFTLTLTLAILAIDSGTNIISLLPVLGALVLSAYKMLPAAQLIYSSMMQIRFSEAAYDQLLIKLEALEQSEPESDAHQLIGPSESFEEIEFEDISFFYQDSDMATLSDFSVRFESNDFVYVVGSTGCGKTTFLELFLGLLRPSRGRILLNKRPFDPANQKHFLQIVGYVPQQVYLVDDSIATNIAFGESPDEIDWERLKVAARIARVDQFVNEELTDGYYASVGENGSRLSGGQRQRIGIARAIYKNPKILVFDEATSALDTETEKLILDGIRSLSSVQLVLFVTHRIGSISDNAKILVVENGQISDFGLFHKVKVANSIVKGMLSTK